MTLSSRCQVLALALLVAACGKEGDANVSLKRTGDAPAVTTVEGSAQLDLGAAKEVEPNNDAASATPVELPVAVTGVLTTSRDIDMFSFVSPANGYVRVFLRPVDGADLMVEEGIASAAGKGTKSLVRIADRGPNTSEGIPNLPVTKGATYHIAVKEYVKQPRRRRKKKKGDKPPELKVRDGDSPPYQLEISFEEPPKASSGIDLESEPNDTPENARVVLSGQRPMGYIGWAGDVDFYKLSLEHFGDKDLVEMSIDGVDGVTLSLVLTNPDGETVLRRKGGKGSSIYVRGLPTEGAEYLMAKLTAKRSHESQRYRFHFASSQYAQGDEVEPNDTAKRATVLGEDGDGDDGDDEGSARGEVYENDIDWFVLPKSKKRRELELTIDYSGGARVEVNAVVAGDSLGVARGDVRTMTLVVEPNARIRFKVTAKGGGEPAEYSLSWKTTEASAPADSDEPDTKPSGRINPADLLE